MGTMEYPDWQKPYHEALLEFDQQKLPERLAKAEMAILLRLQELKADPEGRAERQALDNALSNMKVLEREAQLSSLQGKASGS